MTDYIITVEYKGILQFKTTMKFRQPAFNEDHAAKLIKQHSLYPIDGEIIRIKEAAFKKK